MLTKDAMHKSEATGRSVLLLNSDPPPKNMKKLDQITFRGVDEQFLVANFGEFCDELGIGSRFTEFIFPLEADQEHLNRFSEQFKKIFGVEL